MFEVDEEEYEHQHVIPGKGTEKDNDDLTFAEHLTTHQSDLDDEDDEDTATDSEDETKLKPLI